MRIRKKIGIGTRLVLRYSLDFWRANFGIARQVLSTTMSIAPETLVLPTRVEKPLEVLALANLITFTPGTLLLTVTPGRDIRVHVLNDADEARIYIPTQLETPILELMRNDH